MKKNIEHAGELQDFLLFVLFVITPCLAYKVGALLFYCYQGVILSIVVSLFVVLLIAFALVIVKQKIGNIFLLFLIASSTAYLFYLPDFKQCKVGNNVALAFEGLAGDGSENLSEEDIVIGNYEHKIDSIKRTGFECPEKLLIDYVDYLKCHVKNQKSITMDECEVHMRDICYLQTPEMNSEHIRVIVVDTDNKEILDNRVTNKIDTLRLPKGKFTIGVSAAHGRKYSLYYESVEIDSGKVVKLKKD